MTKYRNTLARMGGVLLLAGAFVMLNAAQADAALKLWVCTTADCSGAGSVIVSDGGAGDSDAGTAGSIVTIFSGGRIETALSYPAAGSLDRPYINLTYRLTSSAPGPYIYASFDGFTPPTSAPLRFTANASDGTGSATVYGGAVPFAPPALFGAGALFGPAVMPVATTLFGPAVDPYFLAIGLHVIPGASGFASGDATLQVPEPAMMALFGLGLLGAGVASRRRRKQQEIA